MSITWLILGGCPRSGTTGLMDSLNALPEVGLIPEFNSNRFFQYVENFFKKEDSIHSKSWIGDINLHKREEAEVLTRNFIKYVPTRDRVKEEIIRTIFRMTFEKECRIIGEKFPMYWLLDLEAVAAHVDHLKILQIVRRPSEVVRSYLYRAQLTEQGLDLWKHRDRFDGFRHWIDSWEAIAKYRADGPNSSFLAVKYDDLLTTTEVYDRIADFLDVSSGGSLPLVGGKTTAVVKGYDDEMQEAVATVFGDLEERWAEPVEALVQRYSPSQLRRRLKRLPGVKRGSRGQARRHTVSGWTQAPQVRAMMRKLVQWKG